MKKTFTVLGIVAVSFAAHAQIVINEVYGGGGITGAAINNDFVELINKGTAAVTLSGATLQYASAGGAFSSYQTLPDITLNPGQTFLIQEGTNAASGTTVGATLNNPDFVGANNTSYTTGTTYNSPLNFATGAGKIVLASNNTQVTSPKDANVLDFVGYGTANQYEGAAPAPAPSGTKTISRTNGVDTNANSADFTVTAPTPTNSKGQSLATSEVGLTKPSLVRNTVVSNEIIFGAKSNIKIFNMNGQVVKSSVVEKDSTLNVSSLAKGIYIVTGDVNGQKVSQKIVKQ